MIRRPPRSTLSLHDALPISVQPQSLPHLEQQQREQSAVVGLRMSSIRFDERQERRDRKSTRLNSSHSQISYAVFCLKKKQNHSMRVDGHIPKHECIAY